MRANSRRNRGRRRDDKPAATPAPGSAPAAGTETIDPAHPADAAGQAPRSDPAQAPAQPGSREATQRPEGRTTVLPTPADADARRRARSAERQRAAAEAKRSRAARRRQSGPPGAAPPAKAAAQHRSAVLFMVLTLGVLIAAVAVTGAMIASSMRTRPVTLASPLQIYPVTQATPGQCPAGTRGISGQSGAGPTCYGLAQGIAIRKVADLRVQKSRVRPGGYDVAVTLRPVDRDAFAKLTRTTVGRDLAFVVRDRLITLPRVDMAILDGKVVVTGPANRPAANALVHELKGK